MTLRRSRSCRSLYWNLSFTDFVEDKLTRDPSPVEGSYSSSTSPAPSCHPTLGPILVPALNPALALALALTNELFKKFMKVYLESNQGPRQPLMEHERPLKAKVLELYYGKSHIDCYYFCQQCKDHFEIAGAIGANQTLFVTSFLRGNISVRWT